MCPLSCAAWWNPQVVTLCFDSFLNHLGPKKEKRKEKKPPPILPVSAHRLCTGALQRSATPFAAPPQPLLPACTQRAGHPEVISSGLFGARAQPWLRAWRFWFPSVRGDFRKPLSSVYLLSQTPPGRAFPSVYCTSRVLSLAPSCYTAIACTFKGSKVRQNKDKPCANPSGITRQVRIHNHSF